MQRGVGVITLYADILFLINFSMDTVALYITGRIINRPTKAKRIAISALIGALAATLLTVFISEKYTITEPVISLILSAVMIKFSFGGKITKAEMLRHSLILWGVGALLGGIMTLIVTFSGRFLKHTDNSSSVGFTEIFLLTLAVSCALVRLISSRRGKKSVEISFTLDGMEYILEVLCDTGSSLTEPLTSLPVIIVSSSYVKELALRLRKAQSGEDTVKLRAIPMKSAAGERLLFGFVPDKLEISGKAAAGVIAIDEENYSYSGFGGVLPSVLV